LLLIASVAAAISAWRVYVNADTALAFLLVPFGANGVDAIFAKLMREDVTLYGALAVAVFSIIAAAPSVFRRGPAPAQ
jgi:hypothetical protein